MMAMPVDNCRLCLGPTTTIHTPIVQCFGPVASAGAQQYTVADVLNKHFWFELHKDRDANAFVCQPCWTKVEDFHQFYQSVLVLYHQTGWQPTAKQEPNASAMIDQKLEVILNEDTAAGQTKSNMPSGDCSDDDDDGGADNNDWYDNSFRVDVKLENVDDEATVKAESPPLPVKRPPGRPPNKSKRSTDPINLENRPSSPPVTNSSRRSNGWNSRDCQTTTSSEVPDTDQMIAKYFTLKCDLCDEPLANLTIARNHHQQVHKQRGYMCCSCGQRFVRHASISEHCAFHDDPSPHKCMECCKIFTNAGRLASHRIAKHPMTGSLVADAAASPSSASAQRFNAATATKSTPGSEQTSVSHCEDELMRRYMSMVCTMCEGSRTSYESFRKLRQHQRKAHGQTGFLECCGKRFLKKCHAVEHCKWHENPTQFDCNICGRSFAKSVYLRDHHIRRHSSSAPFIHQCDQCDRHFQMAEQLRYHKRRYHMSDDERKFECFSCHRRFVFQSHLRIHLRATSDEAPTFMCDVCAKHFKSKYSYDQHYAIEHGTVIKCKCPECGKWLKHASQLTRHMAQHRSLPSKCEECDHVAPNRRALYMHRRRVHCEPSHKCLVCDRMFKRPQSLREHMAMHAGITDLYTCAYCPQTFRSDSNMCKHRRQVHAAQFEADRRAAKLAEDLRNTEEAAAARAAHPNGMRF